MQRVKGHAALRVDSLFAEVDMLDEYDLAVVVFDNVVAAEPIAVLIEIVGALGARVALHAQDRLPDLLRLIDAVFGDHARRISVVRTAAEQPWIVHMGKSCVGATYHYRSAGPLNVWRHRMDLGAANRSNEGRNVLVFDKLAKSEHNPRIGRLVILYDKLDLSAKHTACLVYLLDCKVGTLNLVTAGFGRRSGDWSYHADFERLCGVPETGEHGQHTG